MKPSPSIRSGMAPRPMWAMVCLAVFGLLAPLGASAAPPNPDVETETVVYAESGGQTLRMTIYRPAEDAEDAEENGGEAALRPAVVMFHGGFWTVGLRQTLYWYGETFASRGYVAASANYRRMPGSPFPEPLHDAKAAVRWMRLNAERYGVDPDRIASMGLSAGGHLATLVAVTTPEDGFEGPTNEETSSAVQAAINFYGPVDLNAYAHEDQGGPISWLTGQFMDSFTRGLGENNGVSNLTAASPIHYVGPHVPPMLIVHGGNDSVVPLEQSEMFFERLREHGTPAWLVVADERRHAFGRYPSPVRDKVMEEVFAFLEQHLAGGAEEKITTRRTLVTTD